MDEEPLKSPAPSDGTEPFQFSLLSLCGLTTFCAVVFALIHYLLLPIAILLSAVLLNVCAMFFARSKKHSTANWAKRITLLFLLSGTMFFDGCEKNRYLKTTTGIIPYAQFTLEEKNKTTYRFSAMKDADLSILFLSINIVVLLAGVIAVTKYWKWLDRHLTSTAFLIWFWICVALFNCFMVPYGVYLWFYGVLIPTGWFVGMLKSVFPPGSSLPIIIGSRAYFFLFLLFGVLLSQILFKWKARRMKLSSTPEAGDVDAVNGDE